MGDDGTSYLYTGQEFDPESQYYYYNARYYDPAIGRFLSRDPFSGRDGDVLSRNGYIYVKNNPLKYVDPSGEIERDASGSGFWDNITNNIYVQGVAGWGVGSGIGVQSTGQYVLDSVRNPWEAIKGIGTGAVQNVVAWGNLFSDLTNDYSNTVNEITTG